MQRIKTILDKCGTAFNELYRYSVKWIFFIILMFLCFIASFSTTVLVHDNDGGHFFIKDYPIVNFLSVIGILAIGYILMSYRPVVKFVSRVNADDSYFRSLRRRMLAVLGIVSVLWVLSTQFIPKADQLKVQDGVYELLIEDYTRFSPGDYLERHQHQYGLLLMSYVFSLIFGSSNYAVLQLFNAAALLLFFYELSELCGYFGFRRSVQLSVIIFGFVFYPLIVYCSFIYGTLVGLALAVTAICWEMKFFSSKKISHAIISAILMTFSILAKSTYAIFLVAAMIFAVVEIVRLKKVKLIIFPVSIMIAAVIALSVPHAIMSQIVGDPLDEGTSMWGFIAMGLQDGDRAPGAYNGYVDKLYYSISNCDSELYTKLAKENIAERLKYFLENKSYAVSFFTQKLAYEWNDPTFQSAWNIRGKSSLINTNEWIWKFQSSWGTKIGVTFLNPLIFAVYFGALLFSLRYRKEKNNYTFVFPMIFIGGFVFQIFTEAGPRYTLPYFVLLFPFAIEGYFGIVRRALREERPKGKRVKREEFKRKIFGLLPYICMTVIFSVLICVLYVGRAGYLTSDNEAYSEWLESNSVEQLVKEGNYTLLTESGLGIESVQIEESENANGDIILSDAPTDFRLVYYKGTYWIKFAENYQYLTVVDNSDENHLSVAAAEHKDSDDERQWSLAKTGDGGFNILYKNKYALTFNEKNGSVYVSEFTGKSNQIWYFEKQ